MAPARTGFSTKHLTVPPSNSAMPRQLGLILVLVLPAPAFADGDANLAAFFKSYLDAPLKHSPYEASRLGDHRFDDRLDDLSRKARAAAIERQKNALARLPKEVAFDKLSGNGKVDYQILRDALTKNIWLAEHTKPFEEDPRLW